MAKQTKPLSDTQIKRAKAGFKPVKLYDGYGLYLEATIPWHGMKLGKRRLNP